MLYNLMGSWAVALIEIIPSKQEVEEMSDTLVLLVVFRAMVQDIFKKRFGSREKKKLVGVFTALIP